jgi:hypothetical protein
MERCVLCGGQAISCSCIYELNGMPYHSLEEDHPDVYNNGPTEEMNGKREEAEEKAGGRLPWSGIYPGTEMCVEYGWFCKDVDGEFHVPCSPEDPAGHPDLNYMLAVCRWDVSQRRHVLSGRNPTWEERLKEHERRVVVRRRMSEEMRRGVMS